MPRNCYNHKPPARHTVEHGSDDLLLTAAGILSCLDGYMNIALEQTEVRGLMQQQIHLVQGALLQATAGHAAVVRAQQQLKCSCDRCESVSSALGAAVCVHSIVCSRWP